MVMVGVGLAEWSREEMDAELAGKKRESELDLLRLSDIESMGNISSLI